MDAESQAGMGPPRHMLGLGKHLRDGGIGNIMEDRFHERAIESRACIERRNHGARYCERAESCRSYIRGIELIRSIDVGMNTVNGLILAPGLKGRVELSNRPYDGERSYPCCTPMASSSAAFNTSPGCDFKRSLGILFLR